MCSLNRMDDRDWISKWAQDIESLVNLMPEYQVHPDQSAPVSGTRPTASGT
ncbi:hypothetical protein SAMN05216228_101654 [Rhizobium tibeticum]|uniref:Uncharacterized protein n=1 Tax=Rhizobium tibeticum TaxID=501024 RepID=A0A1H8P841_9HYPH|nr:hypothetical protein RTCCBAU85039_3761 [Rhizobium tibeticum]SEO37808.1 hypothetical protein SAMN05216228_101654 [Rhizobium tibeticum]